MPLFFDDNPNSKKTSWNKPRKALLFDYLERRSIRKQNAKPRPNEALIQKNAERGRQEQARREQEWEQEDEERTKDAERRMAAGQKLEAIEDRRPGESNWYGGDTHETHPSTVKEKVKTGGHLSTVNERVKKGAKSVGPLVRQKTGTESHLKH
jgi:hypothetical protein